MHQPDPSTRPSQVTLAGWAIAVASALLVLAVFNTMGQLDSVDMRERLTHAISSGWVEGLGITLAGATEVVRWCLYVSGVAAAASAVLGVFVLQGHRGARIGVTVAAVAIVLTASLASVLTGFLALALAFCSGLLWSGPAADWFAGRPIRVRPRPVERRREPNEPSRPSTSVAWSPPAPGSAQPPPTSGWGQVPSPPHATGVPSSPGQPSSTGFAGWSVPASGGRRPVQVRLACVLTWVFSSVVALGYTAVFVVLLVNKPWVARELEKSPGWNDSFDVGTVTAVATGASVVFVLWSVCAIVLAVLVWRRVRWAWIALLVSTCVAGLVSVLGFPFSLPYVAAIGVTAGMLLRRPTRDWFADPPYAGPPYPGPPAGPSGPPSGPPMAPPTGQQQRPPVW